MAGQLLNAGSIGSSASNTINVTGQDSLVQSALSNAGNLTGSVTVLLGSVQNAGTITGNVSANQAVNNSLTIIGNVTASNGILQNSGNITGIVRVDHARDPASNSFAFTNSGTITGNVFANTGSIANSGKIIGDVQAQQNIINLHSIIGSATASRGYLFNGWDGSNTVSLASITGNTYATGQVYNAGSLGTTFNNTVEVYGLDSVNNFALSNTGTITANVYAYAGSVQNSGIIMGNINAQQNLINSNTINGSVLVTNGYLQNNLAGSITGDASVAGVINNTGSIGSNANNIITSNAQDSNSIIAINNSGSLKGIVTANAGSINNTGSILGTLSALANLTNSGVINANITASNGFISNTGQITGSVTATHVTDNGTNLAITNTGKITGAIYANAGSLNNTGNIIGDVVAYANITNMAKISGSVTAVNGYVDNGANLASISGNVSAETFINNQGTIGSNASNTISSNAADNGATLAVINHGTITGTVNANLGSIDNTGSIIGNASAAQNLSNLGLIKGSATASNGYLTNGSSSVNQASITGNAYANGLLENYANIGTNSANSIISNAADSNSLAAITNFGSLNGTVIATAGSVHNSGQITGKLESGAGDITNRGLILGNVLADLGSINNTGSIIGNVTANQTIINTSNIIGSATASKGYLYKGWDGSAISTAASITGDVFAQGIIINNGSLGSSISNVISSYGSDNNSYALSNTGAINGNVNVYTGSLHTTGAITGDVLVYDNVINLHIINGSVSAQTGYVYNGSISNKQAVINGNVISGGDITNYGQINLNSNNTQIVQAGNSVSLANLNNYGDINALNAASDTIIHAYGNLTEKAGSINLLNDSHHTSQVLSLFDMNLTANAQIKDTGKGLLFINPTFLNSVLSLDNASISSAGAMTITGGLHNALHISLNNDSFINAVGDLILGDNSQPLVTLSASNSFVNYDYGQPGATGWAAITGGKVMGNFVVENSVNSVFANFSLKQSNYSNDLATVFNLFEPGSYQGSYLHGGLLFIASDKAQSDKSQKFVNANVSVISKPIEQPQLPTDACSVSLGSSLEFRHSLGSLPAYAEVLPFSVIKDAEAQESAVINQNNSTYTRNLGCEKL